MADPYSVPPGYGLSFLDGCNFHARIDTYRTADVLATVRGTRIVCLDDGWQFQVEGPGSWETFREAVLAHRDDAHVDSP